VEMTLNGMKNTTTHREYDELVLASIDVYGIELHDMNAASAFTEKLNDESSKIRAHIATGQLKEAYLLAVKINDIEAVKKIGEEAANEGNKRVEQLCDQYIQQQQNPELKIES